MSAIFTYNPTDSFEQLYIRLRQKEGRIYKDEEVAKLPAIQQEHPLYHEWQVRERSLKKLVVYLKHQGHEPAILEVGCGNGWLSAQLALLTNAKITGIDVNGIELDQAKRVFHLIPNLEFIQCELISEPLQEKVFDVILFAASIQYFPSLRKLIAAAANHLTLQGEIYIMDSVFYKPNQIAAARQRTADHFNNAGCDEMTAFYFHHSMEELKRFNYRILSAPSFLLNRLSKNKNPFYHVVIKDRYQ